jgi:hypothetical protein
MDLSSPRDGVGGFIADLAEEGMPATLEGAVVHYHIVPASGALAGQPVLTGVGADELQVWPAAPPHWIHLPDNIEFATTNVDRNGVIAGWRRHSRDTGIWDTSRRPILSWLAHVRGVLGQVA